MKQKKLAEKQNLEQLNSQGAESLLETSLSKELEAERQAALEKEIGSNYQRDLDSQLNLEEQLIEEFSRDHNQNWRETLLGLRKAGEETLRKLSAVAVETFNSNKLIVRLRDEYVSRRSAQVYKELSVNNSLAQADDYDSFLRLVASDFWGTSSRQEEALFHANSALGVIIGRFPEKTDDVLAVWPKLLSRPDQYNNSARKFSDFIDSLIKEVEYNNAERSQNLEKFRRSDNDFIAAGALVKSDNGDPEVQKEALARIDSIISNFPRLRAFPSQVRNLCLDFFSERPEELLNDSRRLDFVFRVFQEEIENSSDVTIKLVNFLPFIAERVKNCSQEEAQGLKVALKEKWSYGREAYNWLLPLLPLKSREQKLFEEGYSKDSAAVIMKRAELSKRPLLEEEVELLVDAVRKSRSLNKMGLLSVLSAKGFGNGGLFSAEAANRLISSMELENLSYGFSLTQLHSLSLMMERASWPEEMKEKIFSHSGLDRSELNDIFSGTGEKYDWIKREPLLSAKLEAEFHKRGAINDLRHYFYEVLDGQKTTNDLDRLIKSYGESQSHFDLEEIKNLFFVQRLDTKYIEYFIDRLPTLDLMQGIDSQVLSPQESAWLLEMSVKHGALVDSDKVLRKLFQLESYQDPEKRQEILSCWESNIIKQLGRKHNGRSFVPGHDYYKTSLAAGQTISSQSSLKDFLVPEELATFRRNLMERAFELEDDSNLTLFLLSYPESIIENFPSKDAAGLPVSDRKEYLDKLLNRLLSSISDNSHSRLFIVNYFSHLEPALEDEALRLRFDNRLFSTLGLSNPSYFIESFPSMTEAQKERFFQYFEKNFSIINDYDRNVSDLCSTLCRSNLATQQELKGVFLKLLNDPKLSANNALALFNKEFIFTDNDVRQAFFSNLDNWPAIDGNNILQAAAERRLHDGQEVISQEEAKKISAFTLSNRGLSPRFWQGYLDSDPERPLFYLDDDLFDLGINNIGNDCYNNNAQTVISFLESVRTGRFGLEELVIEKVVRGAIIQGSYLYSRQNWETFLRYRPELTEEIAIDYGFRNCLKTVLEVDFPYSPKFKEAALNYIFGDTFKSSYFEDFLLYLKKIDDQELISRTKNNIAKLEIKERERTRLMLLQHDLLDVWEARELYQDLVDNSQKGVREQILISIDIISSMLSNRNNLSQLEMFFDNPRPEQIKSLREISDFIDAYSQENKGRSIAVMLFAREYLPGRDLGEVVERVGSSLHKYREVIDKNTYQHIPDGLQASIGMEYEITSSTADAYQKLTGQSSLKSDIARLSAAARIGSGMDAVHEIATRPTSNPYLLLLEMKLLHDIEYIDLNFDRSPEYQSGARGFHLTIGGEKGLAVDQETNFLQNAIIAACWGGVQAGETGHRVNGGRGISLRNRLAGDGHNVAFFGQPTDSVELRSLSIDKQETLQRAVLTAHNGAIAIQAFRDCFGTSGLSRVLYDDRENINQKLNLQDKDPKTKELATIWIELISRVTEAVKSHNESFLDREMYGYLDEKGVWVDAADFGGEYNKKRFLEIVENIDPTLSLEEYGQSTRIEIADIFQSFNLELSDKLTRINNLFLKPGARFTDESGEKKRVFKGDHANAISMLDETKLGNDQLENLDKEFLRSTVFDTGGEKRQGYYCIQGGSELMLTHAVQQALLDFNAKMEQALR